MDFTADEIDMLYFALRHAASEYGSPTDAAREEFQALAHKMDQEHYKPARNRAETRETEENHMYAQITPPREIYVVHYHANVHLVRDVEPGTQSIEYLECDHYHTTPEAATRCAERLARKHTKDVR